MFWMKLNFWLYEKTMELDPARVLEFLVQELDESEKCGQRVWIIGHIAPGLTDFLYDYSASFDKIVQRYHDSLIRPWKSSSDSNIVFLGFRGLLGFST
jgi:sphingomyelin phosphodiesterase